MKQAGWRWFELGEGRWSWVAMNEAGWKWVHGLAIPFLECRCKNWKKATEKLHKHETLKV